MKKSLEGAIVERFAATPDLATVDGGCTFGQIPDYDPAATPRMYVVFIENGEVTWYYSDSGRKKARRAAYRFLCHVPTHYDGVRLRLLLELAFGPAALLAEPLEYEGGACGDSMPGDSGMDLREYQDSKGKKLLLHYIDFRFTVNLTS